MYQVFWGIYTWIKPIWSLTNLMVNWHALVIINIIQCIGNEKRPKKCYRSSMQTSGWTWGTGGDFLWGRRRWVSRPGPAGWDAWAEVDQRGLTEGQRSADTLAGVWDIGKGLQDKKTVPLHRRGLNVFVIQSVGTHLVIRELLVNVVIFLSVC